MREKHPWPYDEKCRDCVSFPGKGKAGIIFCGDAARVIKENESACWRFSASPASSWVDGENKKGEKN